MARYQVGDAEDLGIDSQMIREFLQQEWERPLALSMPWFYDWQFRQSPDNAGEDRCVVVVGGDSTILGFMGLNRRAFYQGGEARRGCELTTWVVSKKARGTGCGRAILEYLKQSYEIIVGIGVSAQAVPVFTGLGFRYVQHVPRYVRVFNLPAVTPISKISPLGHKLILQYQSMPSLTYRPAPIALSEAAEFANALHCEFQCFSRDAAYLKWRYADHPVYRYQAFRIEFGQEAAAVILRTDQKGDLKIVHVIDVFGHPSALPGVVHFLETFCKDESADIAEFYCTSNRIAHTFWHYGWFSVLDDIYIQVPHLFYPVEMRTPPTSSLTLWSKGDMRSLLDLSRLYISKGDCDLDRPTKQYLIEKGILRD